MPLLITHLPLQALSVVQNDGSMVQTHVSPGELSRDCDEFQNVRDVDLLCMSSPGLTLFQTISPGGFGMMKKQLTLVCW